jgi:flavin-dependent dehydrogenase
VTDHDVVIIGAGPAGAAAAILCAQRGLRVALLEQAVFPRKRPGETLQPGAELLLQQLGVADAVQAAGFLRHTGHWVQWGGARQFSAFGQGATGPERGFQIPRDVLDGLLLCRAIESGVRVVQPCHVLKVIKDQQRVCGVQTRQDDFTAPQVIDASGASSWLSRQLQLRWRRFSPPLIAHYGYAAGASPEDEIFCGIEADPLGWYWTAKIDEYLFHWTRLNFFPDNKAQGIPPATFKHLTASGPARGADVTWRVCQQAAGDGFFIAGDAAFVLDPAASQGVLKALMSGMMAAHAVIQARSTPWHELSIQQQYQQWLNEWFNRDRRRMCELYRAHPFPPTWLFDR